MSPLRHPQRQAFAQMFGLQTVADGARIPVPMHSTDGAAQRVDVTCNLGGGTLRRLYQELSMNALRRGEPLSLVVFDFEAPSRAGNSPRDGWDRIMTELSGTLMASFRASDVLARWGDDQLAALLPGTQAAGAARAAQKALIALAQNGYGPAARRAHLYASAGVAAVAPGSPFTESLNEALANAELARRSGGGRVFWQGGELVVVGTGVALYDPDAALSGYEELFARIGVEPRLVDSVDACAAAASELALIIVVLGPDPDPGFHQLERIREVRALRDRAVLVVGGSTELPRSFDLGADDFVVRPIDPAELGARIQRILGRHRPAPPLQP